MRKFMVILGDITSGHDFIGPFDTAEDAQHFIEYTTEDGEGQIILLSDPVTYFQESLAKDE